VKSYLKKEKDQSEKDCDKDLKTKSRLIRNIKTS
jgi:hypothetical protein